MSAAAEPLSARDREGREALAACLAAARAWLAESEWHENTRIEVHDGVNATWLFVSRKDPGMGVVRVRPAYRGDPTEDVPADGFLDSPAARALYDADTYKWTHWQPHLPSDGGALPADWSCVHADVLARAKSAAAQRDSDDQDEYKALQKKLFDIIFPVWVQVADGKMQAKWMAAQSTDNLTFFTEWLLLQGPADRARFFLAAPSEEEIAAELDRGAVEGVYVGGDGFLWGYTAYDRPTEALTLFRERRPALSPAAPPAA